MSRTLQQGSAWSSVAEQRKAIFASAMLPMHQALLDDTAAGPGHKVLDVGCGTGELAAQAIERGCITTGFDIATTMIDICRADPRLAAGTFGVADAQRMPFASGSFDIAVASVSIHFCDDPVQALREMHRVLRPGGMIGVSSPAAMDLSALIVFRTAAELLPELAPETTRPLTFAPAGLLASKLEEIGFRNIRDRRVEVRVTGETFDELFAKQLTWAPIRRAVDAVGMDKFMSVLRPKLVEAVGTAEPTSLDLSSRVVTAQSLG